MNVDPGDDALRPVSDEELRALMGRVVYWTVRGELEEDGMGPVAASPLVLRCARLVVLMLLGVEQYEAAELLAVSKRTAGFDLARWCGGMDRSRGCCLCCEACIAASAG